MKRTYSTGPRAADGDIKRPSLFRVGCSPTVESERLLPAAAVVSEVSSPTDDLVDDGAPSSGCSPSATPLPMPQSSSCTNTISLPTPSNGDGMRSAMQPLLAATNRRYQSSFSRSVRANSIKRTSSALGDCAELAATPYASCKCKR